MRRVSSTVLGSRLAVAITTAIITTVVVAGGIAVASVPNNSVGTLNIIDNSIRSRDIRNGTVQSVDIRDRTIRVRDLAGSARASTAIGNYNDAIQLVQSATNPTSGNLFSRTATCPAGKRAVAGGGSLPMTNTFISGSGPETSGQNPQGWTVVWKTTNNVTVDPPSLTVWALCMPDTIP